MGKSFEIALTAAKEYADLVLKEPMSELSGILSDSIGQWRLRNKVNILLKTQEWMRKKGVSPNKISPGIFVPIIEEGGNVEENDLSIMFSSLLANHLDPDKNNDIHPSFSKVLSQLSSTDAVMLTVISKYVSNKADRNAGLRGGGISVVYIVDKAERSKRATYMSCLNLARLGLIEHCGFTPPSNHAIPEMFSESPKHQDYRVTEYGIEFLEACTYDA